MRFSSTVSEGEPNVLAVFTRLNVSLVTVGLYYLPSNEPNTTRYRGLNERAYGTKDIFGYPIGAQLLSSEPEYTIPSDRLFYERNFSEFKYFREMRRHNHMDARFGKAQYARFNDVKRSAIFRGIFAAWYVYGFRI
jgi:hypothetical protein